MVHICKDVQAGAYLLFEYKTLPEPNWLITADRSLEPQRSEILLIHFMFLSTEDCQRNSFEYISMIEICDITIILIQVTFDIWNVLSLHYALYI